MCYRVSTASKWEEIEEDFNAKFHAPEAYTPYFHANGFGKDIKLPVISDEDKNSIQLIQWGNISYPGSKKLYITINARGDELFEKSTFKKYTSKRCMILVNGFFEHHDKDDVKYPYYIQLKHKRSFAFAGLNCGGLLSVVTCDANPLMAKIHNGAKRMPVILPKERYAEWLRPDLTKEEILNLVQPYPEEEMEAYTVSKLLTSRKLPTG